MDPAAHHQWRPSSQAQAQQPYPESQQEASTAQGQQKQLDSPPSFLPATFLPGAAAAARTAQQQAAAIMQQRRRSLDAMPPGVVKRVLNALPIDSKLQLGQVCRTLAAAVRRPEGALTVLIILLVGERRRWASA